MDLFTIKVEYTSVRGKKDVRYISGTRKKDTPPYRFTTDISRVPYEFLFNTTEKAQAKISQVKTRISDIYNRAFTKYNKQQELNKKHGHRPEYKTHYKYKQNYDGSEYIDGSTLSGIKKLMNSELVVVPYDIEGKFNKSRICESEWVENSSPNKFCNICGCNILTERFFSVGKIYKMCPVCIHNFDKIASDEIALASEHWGIDILHENEVQRFVGRL